MSCNRRHTLQLLAALCSMPGMVSAAMPAAGLPNLRKGINLTHWFEYERGQAVSASEMKHLKAIGMDHVRLPVDPMVNGWQPAANARLDSIPELRRAIQQAVDAGLEVVLDLHMTPELKLLIEKQRESEQAIINLWAQLAKEFASFPTQKLAFELFNEPQYYSWRAWQWPGIQQRLLASVRAHAPKHLVLLSGNRGGSFKGLTDLPLVKDPAVAYVFHYYDPFLFTHQGADWIDTQYTTAGLHSGIIYPAENMIAAKPKLSRSHPKAAEDLADYVKTNWGLRKLRQDLDAAGQYARKHGIRVVCNEFGVIRANVDPASRYRWLKDVRESLEANGIGWTVWDYTDIFGITVESAQTSREGSRRIDALAYSALGLAAP